jgi:nucleoside-diphosphate-sugar epimerase
MKNIIITGSTGMIGSLILEYCLNSQEVSKVISLVRRSTGISHQKLDEIVVNDFMNLDENAHCFESIDVVYYCQGVYTGVVERDQFRKITVDYPEILGKILIQHNPNLRFCLLSGAGADRKEKSRFLFAKNKGTIENRLSMMGFAAFHSFRPSYIYPVTPRKEPNFSYTLSRFLYPLIRRLGTGVSIKSTELALVMFKIGIEGCDKEILENKDILEKI